MNVIPVFILAALSAFFLSSCGGSSSTALHPAQPPTGAEAPLFKAINKIRTDAGKKALTRSANLDAIAASESARLAATGSRTPNVSKLRSNTGYGTMFTLVGGLKDRGPETGAKFPSYWAKSPKQKNYLLGDHHRVGIGTAKSKEGELVTIVIFAQLGSSSIMAPMGL